MSEKTQTSNNRLQSQFKQYRDKNFFIDAKFKTENTEIVAHRLVLAKYSKLFADYFENQPFNPDNIHIPIPFDINNLFPELINFLYTEELPLDDPDPIPYYAMAHVYNIDILKTMLRFTIERFLKENYEYVLTYTSHYITFELPKGIELTFPTIRTYFDELIGSSQEFAPLIVEHFEEFRKNISVLYNSVIPILFANILGNLNNQTYIDYEKARMIDEYVKNYKKDLTIYEREKLQQVIDWNTDDSYLLFASLDLDWVLPVVSRPLLRKLLSNRMTTTHSFEQTINTISNQYINCWYAFDWLQTIRDSRGCKELEPVELITFLGTLGNSCNFVNPLTYGFIEENCSETLCVPAAKHSIFSPSYIFDNLDSSHYYLSNPDLKEPHVGFRLFNDGFKPRKLFLQQCPIEKKPKIVKCKIEIERTKVNDRFDHQDDVPREFIEFSFPKVDPMRGVTVTLIGNNTAAKSFLRVKKLRVEGVFVP